MPKNDPKPLPPLTASDIARFWGHVDMRGPDECWPWTAARYRRGYGVFNCKKDGGAKWSVVTAPRIAYFLYHGEDAWPLFVLHSCDNPPCCNGAHLFKGTNADNAKDRGAKGRSKGRHKGAVCNWVQPNRKLSYQQAQQVRNLYALGGTSCRELGEKFNVSTAVIYFIVKMKTYRTPPDLHGE